VASSCANFPTNKAVKEAVCDLLGPDSLAVSKNAARHCCIVAAPLVSNSNHAISALNVSTKTLFSLNLNVNALLILGCDFFYVPSIISLEPSKESNHEDMEFNSFLPIKDWVKSQKVTIKV